MTTRLYDPLTYENLMLGLIMRFEQEHTVDLDSESAIANVQGATTNTSPTAFRSAPASSKRVARTSSASA